MKRETAQQLVEMIHGYDHRLEQAIEMLMREQADPQELRRFKLAVGNIMADGMDGILANIYAQHPTLAPEWWK